MNIGLLIRGARAGAKLAGKGARAAGSKTKSVAKAVGKSKAVKGARSAGGKLAEGIGYAATPGLRRSAKGRYFKKARGTGPIRSVSKAKVRGTGKKVIGGASAVGAGAVGAKAVKAKLSKKSRKPTKEVQKVKATPASTTTPASKPKLSPVKFKGKPTAKKARESRSSVASDNRFARMTPAQKKNLTGRDRIAYEAFLKRRKAAREGRAATNPRERRGSPRGRFR